MMSLWGQSLGCGEMVQWPQPLGFYVGLLGPNRTKFATCKEQFEITFSKMC